MNQIARRQLLPLGALATAGPSDPCRLDFSFRGPARADLGTQWAACIRDDGPRNSLKEDAVFIRYLLGDSDKNLAARALPGWLEPLPPPNP